MKFQNVTNIQGTENHYLTTYMMIKKICNYNIYSMVSNCYKFYVPEKIVLRVSSSLTQRGHYLPKFKYLIPPIKYKLFTSIKLQKHKF